MHRKRWLFRAPVDQALLGRGHENWNAESSGSHTAVDPLPDNIRFRTETLFRRVYICIPPGLAVACEIPVDNQASNLANRSL